MAVRHSKLVLSLLAALLLAMMHEAAVGQGPDMPRPVLKYVGWQDNTENGRTLRQYKFEIVNHDAFPDELFAPAPDLEPCGRNANASRTWINIYDGTNGRRIYGFCAIRNSTDLAMISFNMPPSAEPPAKIYIDFVDRRTRTVYRSKKVNIEP